MTTWTIKVAHPVQQAGGVGFAAALTDTGLRYDDSVTLKAWCPAGSTVNIRVGRLMALLEQGEKIGFKYFADNGGGTILPADTTGAGIRQES